MQHWKILVTGGAGFIGSAVVRQYLSQADVQVITLDSLTYAGNPDSLGDALENPRHTLEKVDICNRAEVERVFREHEPDAVMHLAAESHVDRSIRGPSEFVTTNIIGTYTLLEVARAYWSALEGIAKETFRFHHVSTDEVYGDLGPGDAAFTEENAYAPSSPYSATKASSDHLVRAWQRTYGLPAIVTNCSNNYGPYQFPEKLVPLMILNAIEHKPLPVYGTGDNVRDWLFVEDHASALRLVLEKGRIGQTYNIGGRSELTNLEVVEAICDLVHRIRNESKDNEHEGAHVQVSTSSPAISHPRELIAFVTDRPGHDRRYAIDNSLIEKDLAWHPKESFVTGLEKTVRWYLENPEWVERVRTGAYRAWIETNYGRREIRR